MPRIKSDDERKSTKTAAGEPAGKTGKAAKTKKADKAKIAALIWYEPEHYPRVVKIMSDRGDFPTTYEGWAAPARRQERARREDGWQIIRVPLDPTVFRAWCSSRGLKRDSDARKAYAIDGARERLREQREKASVS